MPSVLRSFLFMVGAACIALAMFGCATPQPIRDIGKAIDDVCVKGRLTASEAAALDRMNAETDDRVITKDCSELLRALSGRN